MPPKTIEVLSRTVSMIPDEKGELKPYTYVVFRDEEGIIGMVTIPGKDVSDADIKMAVLKQREERKARKPHVIAL